MIPKLILPAFLVLMTILACQHSGDFPAKVKEDQIHFGQGGGFSGFVTYFILLKDGRLFQRNLRDSSYAYQGKWPAEFVEQMFKNYYALQLDQEDANQPGDLYYFIEYHTPHGKVYRTVWGRPGYKPNDNVVNFYNLLYRSTKSKS